jgi:hypothetical protein
MADPRPADECPYRRPLPEAFGDCVTFHPVRFVPLTSRFEPLRPVLSCRHMELGLRPQAAGRAYYCRCAVGDAKARERLATSTGAERARLLRELADGVMGVVLENWETLAAVKGRELAARTEQERRQAVLEVKRAAQFISAEMRRVLTERWLDHLRRLDVRLGDLVAVIDAGVEDFEKHGFAGWHPPEELLAKLPRDVAAFLRPDAELATGTG